MVVGGTGQDPLPSPGVTAAWIRGLGIRPATEHSCDPRCVPQEQQSWSKGSGKNRQKPHLSQPGGVEG